MNVLVATVVHHPLDARIFARQIGALLDAGHEVIYAAPWSATDTEIPTGLATVDLPRAVGRRRGQAVRATRRALREYRDRVDLVLLHDPELLPALWRQDRPPTVWDVHEDVAASLSDRAWVPRWARPVAGGVVRLLERWAERNLHLLLAEDFYAERFRKEHPVVRNEPSVPEEVPPPGDDRLVYVGRVSESRGATALRTLARTLDGRVHVEAAGDADDAVRPTMEHTPGLVWHGRLEYQTALELVEGSLAGLSLLADEPNFRSSRPTKVVDYMSRGVPVITTPNPIAAEIVERHRCGIVVDYGDLAAVVEAVEYLRTHPSERREMGRRAHAAAQAHFNWDRSGPEFVRTLERLAGSR